MIASYEIPTSKLPRVETLVRLNWLQSLFTAIKKPLHSGALFLSKNPNHSQVGLSLHM
jgi:hypothetical protein